MIIDSVIPLNNAWKLEDDHSLITFYLHTGINYENVNVYDFWKSKCRLVMQNNMKSKTFDKALFSQKAEAQISRICAFCKSFYKKG